MALSVIDGAVRASELKRRSRGINLYKSVSFASADGGERTLKNLVVSDAVASRLTPGTRGRFYLHTMLDARGLHGFRGADGSTSFAYPHNLLFVFRILTIMNLAWILLRLFLLGDGVPMLGVLLFLAGAAGWVQASRLGTQARQAFDADAAPPAPAATLSGAPA
jgi:hypothetical protein